MSVINRESRKILFNKQNGKSPYSGLPLDRKTQRLETHHKIEKFNGGRNNLENLQLLPIQEHLAIHFMKSRDDRLSNDERLREIDIVLGRMCELNKREKDEFYKLVFEKTGVIVRFI